MENEINRILEFVKQADDNALNDLLNGISKRYSQLHPDWEVVFLSFCKADRALRNQQIQDAFQFLMMLERKKTTDIFPHVRYNSEEAP